MLRPLAVSWLALGSIAISPLAAQGGGGSYALKKCDDLKVPIGMLPKATGNVTFRLGKDGRPDTTSLAVVHLLGMSVAGFKSVAARQLSVCRFDVGNSGLSAPVIATVGVTAGDSVVDIGSATATSDAPTPLALEPFTLPRDTMALADDDRRIEERPRRLECSGQVKGPTVIHASGTSRAAAQQDAQQQASSLNQQFAATHSGTMLALVRVSAAGKPGSQLRVLEMTNPSAAQNQGDQIGNCHYAPARVLGVAVASLFKVSVDEFGRVRGQ